MISSIIVEKERYVHWKEVIWISEVLGFNCCSYPTCPQRGQGNQHAACLHSLVRYDEGSTRRGRHSGTHRYPTTTTITTNVMLSRTWDVRDNIYQHRSKGLNPMSESCRVPVLVHLSKTAHPSKNKSFLVLKEQTHTYTHTAIPHTLTHLQLHLHQ